MHISGQELSIAFTIEEEDGEGKLPMLDVLWSREGSYIKTDVYCKPSHTDNYLQWDCHHLIAHKLSVICIPLYHVQTHITDEERKKVGIETFRTDRRKCGYPNWALKEGQKTNTKKDTSKVKSNNPDSSATPRRRHIVLPYVKGIVERLQRVYKKNNIALHSKAGYTIRQAFGSSRG